jgi:hypothetical protein
MRAAALALLALAAAGCSTAGGGAVTASLPDAECRQVALDPRGAGTFDPVARVPWWWSTGPSPSRTAIEANLPKAVDPACGTVR